MNDKWAFSLFLSVELCIIDEADAINLVVVPIVFYLKVCQVLTTSLSHDMFSFLFFLYYMVSNCQLLRITSKEKFVLGFVHLCAK